LKTLYNMKSIYSIVALFMISLLSVGCHRLGLGPDFPCDYPMFIEFPKEGGVKQFNTRYGYQIIYLETEDYDTPLQPNHEGNRQMFSEEWFIINNTTYDKSAEFELELNENTSGKERRIWILFGYAETEPLMKIIQYAE